MSKEVQLAAGLNDNLMVMKRLYGDQWMEITKPYREFMKEELKRQNSTNPLQVVLGVAKQMSDKGENPVLLIAVATEMAQQN